MQAVVDDGDWWTKSRRRRPAGEALQGARPDAADRRSHAAVRRSRHAVRHHGQPLAHSKNTARINASNPCSEYMFLDDSACNLASLNLMKFVGAGRPVRRRSVPPRRGHDDHGAGNPGRQRQLSDREDRAEFARLPAAGPGLRQPGRAADVAWAALRQRRRAATMAGAITALMCGAGVSDQSRASPKPWARSPATQSNEKPFLDVIRMHRDAVRGIDSRARADGAVSRRAQECWDDALRAGRAARLPQRAGHRARAHRHHRLHDGLRHHRHRARPGAGEVQEAGGRRRDQDRQQHRAAGADQAGLHAGAGGADRQPHRFHRHDRRRAAA